MVPRRFKYGVFLHPALNNPQLVAWMYIDGLLASFVDRSDPSLGSVAVRKAFSITRVDDTEVFAVAHGVETFQLFTDDEAGPVRQGLLEVLDWWNNETILLAPGEKALEWKDRDLPNAWTRSWTDGLVVQNITQYPKRLGHRVLDEWNPGLLYLPFEFTYEPPSPDQERAAREGWWAVEDKRLKETLAMLSPEPGRSWYLARPQGYRNATAPNPSTLTLVGTLEQAEEAAEVFRGPCFLVDASTGQTMSRWADR